MTGPHLTEAQAGRWVSGLIDPTEVPPLEAHLASCPACAALLQREARAELALDAAIEAAAASRRRRRRLALPLAAAAAVLLLASTLALSRGGPAPAPGRVPGLAGVAVPRYEGPADLPVAAAPVPL